MRRAVSILVVLASILALPRPSWAHAVGLECVLRDGLVHVEGFFDDGTNAADAVVIVRDSDGNAVAEGRTDEQGRWSFGPLPPGKFFVELDAGAGHLAKRSITIPAVKTDQPERVSAGQSREEFTSVPMGRIVAGLAMIFAVCWLLLFLRRVRSVP